MRSPSCCVLVRGGAATAYEVVPCYSSRPGSPGEVAQVVFSCVIVVDIIFYYDFIMQSSPGEVAHVEGIHPVPPLPARACRSGRESEISSLEGSLAGAAATGKTQKMCCAGRMCLAAGFRQSVLSFPLSFEPPPFKPVHWICAAELLHTGFGTGFGISGNSSFPLSLRLVAFRSRQRPRTCGPNFLRSRMMAWKKQIMKTTDLRGRRPGPA